MENIKSVVIDAGHGGEPGAIFMGRQEKEDTLRLALGSLTLLFNIPLLKSFI